MTSPEQTFGLAMIELTAKFPWVRRALSPARRFSLAFRGTPYEKEIAKKTVGELADLLHEATVKNNFQKRTVVEHTLNLKLSKVQSNATWWAAGIGFVGALLGAAIGGVFGGSTEKNEHVCNCSCEQQVQRPVAETKSTTSAKVVLSGKQDHVSNARQAGQSKQRNGTAEP